MSESKVQFNLKNVHYAILTETSSGESYGTPVAVPGAVSITLDQDGETTAFYADGVKYYTAMSNAGYSGSLEIARVPDQMLLDIWGMEKDAKGVIMESVSTNYKDFALLFQIDGDADSQHFVFYKCSATRPSITSQTNTETKEPQTATLNLSIAPLLSNGDIKGKTSATSDATTVASWYTTVHTRATATSQG